MKKPVTLLLFLLCFAVLANAGGISGTVHFQNGRSEKFLDARYIKGYFRNDRATYRTGENDRIGSLLTLYNSAYRWMSFRDMASITIEQFDFDSEGDLTDVRVEIRLKNGRTMRNRYTGLETFVVSMDSPIYGTHDEIGLHFRNRLEERSVLNIRRIVFD